MSDTERIYHYHHKYHYLKTLAKQKNLNKTKIIADDLKKLKNIIIKTSAKNKPVIQKEPRRGKKTFPKRKLPPKKKTAPHKELWDQTWVYIDQKDFDNAQEIIDKVLRGSPNRWDFQVLKSLIEYERSGGDWGDDRWDPEIWDKYEKVVLTYDYYGMAFNKSKEELKEEKLRKRLKRESKFYRYLCLVGFYFSRKGGYLSSIKFLKKSIEKNSTIDNYKAFKFIIADYIRVGNISEVIGYLQKLIKIRPTYKVFADLSYVLWMKFEWTTQTAEDELDTVNKAIDFVDKSLKIKLNSSAYYVFGLLSNGNMYKDLSIIFFTKAIKLQKKDKRMDLTQLYISRAQVYFEDKKPIKCLADLGFAKKFNTGNIRKRRYPGYFEYDNEQEMVEEINQLRREAISLLKTQKFGKDVRKY